MMFAFGIACLRQAIAICDFLTLAIPPLLSANAVHAQQVHGLCGDRQGMQSQLAQNFNQRPVGSTVVGTSALAELMMSESGSWSLLLSFSDGTACLIDQAGPGGRMPPAPFFRRR